MAAVLAQRSAGSGTLVPMHRQFVICVETAAGERERVQVAARDANDALARLKALHPGKRVYRELDLDSVPGFLRRRKAP